MEGGKPAPLHSTAEATSGELCPELGSPAQEGPQGGLERAQPRALGSHCCEERLREPDCPAWQRGGHGDT